MNGPKLAIGVLWLWGLASFFVAPDSTVSWLGRFLFWILAVVHAIECVVFRSRLRQGEGGLPKQLVQTFLFGIVHVRDLPRA